MLPSAIGSGACASATVVRILGGRLVIFVEALLVLAGVLGLVLLERLSPVVSS